MLHPTKLMYSTEGILGLRGYEQEPGPGDSPLIGNAQCGDLERLSYLTSAGNGFFASRSGSLQRNV
jgi:hypothetical protein